MERVDEAGEGEKLVSEKLLAKAKKEVLVRLGEQCMAGVVLERPSFAQLGDELSQL